MRRAFVSFLSFVVMWVASPAAAQALFEDVGVRARGMGGAFVAVADDADATWWNPAGLATGAFFSAVLEDARAQEPRVASAPDGAPLAAARAASRGFAVSYPALGLSYYRVQISEIRPPTTAAAPGGRLDQEETGVVLRSLVVNQFGATIGQSIGDHLVVASTLKIVRGSVAAAVRPASEATFGAAAGLDGDTNTHGDLDLGVLARVGVVRVGLAVRNVTEPSFGSPGHEAVLGRQARAGAAVTSDPGGAAAAVTVAVDADLTTTATAAGDERHVAAGIEAWLWDRRVGVRGGVRANTVGGARAAGSVGGSLALRSGVYVDGEVTRGGDRAAKSWGGALRVTF